MKIQSYNDFFRKSFNSQIFGKNLMQIFREYSNRKIYERKVEGRLVFAKKFAIKAEIFRLQRKFVVGNEN